MSLGDDEIKALLKESNEDSRGGVEIAGRIFVLLILAGLVGAFVLN